MHVNDGNSSEWHTSSVQWHAYSRGKDGDGIGKVLLHFRGIRIVASSQVCTFALSKGRKPSY